MKPRARRGLGWRWLPLAVFGACLNPQPDDTPMNDEATDVGPPSDPGSTGSGVPDPIFSEGQEPETPADLPSGAGGSGGGPLGASDAGAPPPMDAGPPEADAGVGD